MALVDLKRTKSEKKEEAAEYAAGPSSQPDYGYGLCLHLEDHELEKLGITKLPGVGEEFHLTAVAIVKGVNERDYGDRKEAGMDLQITMMEAVHEAEHADEDNESARAEMAEMKAVGGKSVLNSTYRSR